MASIRQTLFSMALMLLVLPPDALPSSSDGFPWASSSNVGTASSEVEPGVKRDAYGALRDSNMLPDTVSQTVSPTQSSNVNSGTYAPLFTPGNTTRDGRDQRGATMQEGVIAPGGTVSASGVAQGNVGPTQSGPGAVGLFTPNSPGNAAAYNAQVQGGLTASPIVDGNGANVNVTVPMANPSRTPIYQQFSSGTAPGAAPAGTSGSVSKLFGNMGTLGSELVPMGSPRPSAMSVLESRTAGVASPSYRRIPVRVQLASRSFQLRKTATVHPSRPIGDITGSIIYADGQKVLLGSKGAVVVNSKH